MESNQAQTALPPIVATAPTVPQQQMPWWVLPGLAGVVLLIFAGTTVAAFMGSNETLRTTMATAAIGLTTTAAGFFFQSSIGSKDKSDTLAKLAQSQSAGAAAAPGERNQP